MADRRLFGAPWRRFLLRGHVLGALIVLTAVPGAIGASSAAAGGPTTTTTTAVALVTTTTKPPASGEFPSGYLRVEGHGWGPGVGMGQWGAFGYAVQQQPYAWILSHFYGGSTLSTLSPAAEGSVTVAILENAGYPVTVTSKSAFTFGGIKFAAGTAGQASMDKVTGDFTISEASGCTAPPSGWKVLQTGITSGEVTALPASTSPSAPSSELLTLCRGDGVDETLRGSVIAYRYDNTNTNNKPLIRTINELPAESYVADVTTAESSAGWGEVGGPGPQGQQWGFQALEAQAVAARTYLLAYERAGGWYGYADICDSDYCQSYPGIASESPIGLLATEDTAYQYLSMGGAPAPTEYSASTGGYTIPSAFPAVTDTGDSVCLQNTSYWTCNPEHNWSVTLPVATVEAAFPSLGAIQSIRVTSRNGLGSWGGRALKVQLVGASATEVVTGDTFQQRLALDSNWFIVKAAPAPPPATPATPGPLAVRSKRALLSTIGGGTGPLPRARGQAGRG